MYSERSAPTVDLALGAAPGLTLVVGAAYVLAIVALVLSGLALWLRLCLALGIAALGVDWVTRTGLRLRARSPARLVLYPDDECTLVERGGRARAGRIASGAVVTSRLAVVAVRIGRRRLSVPVSSGATDAEGFRQLRVRLTVAPPRAPSLLQRVKEGAARGLSMLFTR